MDLFLSAPTHPQGLCPQQACFWSSGSLFITLAMWPAEKKLALDWLRETLLAVENKLPVSKP